MNNIFISDIHGVLADLHPAWLKVYNDASGDNLTVDKITDWDISSFVLPDWKDKLWEIYEREYLPGLVQPIEGALEGITKLREFGWRVLFVTSPSNNENPLRWYQWLYKFGFVDTMNDFVSARDKSVIRASVIVDDRFETIRNFRGGLGILFSQDWNRKELWYCRAKNWQEVLKYSCCDKVK